MGQLNALDDLIVPTPAAVEESEVGMQPGDFEQLCGGVEFAADDISDALGAAGALPRKRPSLCNCIYLLKLYRCCRRAPAQAPRPIAGATAAANKSIRVSSTKSIRVYSK